MPASELAVQQLANRVGVGTITGRQRVQLRAIAGDDGANVIARHVEHELITANARAPQFRQKLGAVDGSRMQQTIAARRVGRDRERVAGGIRQLDIRVRLHAEIATGGRLTIEAMKA